MSQLIYTPITSGNIAASPNGLSRNASGTVFVTLSAAPAGTPLAVGMTVTVAGATGVQGTSFNGTYPISAVTDQQHFEYQQLDDLTPDTGGGGVISVSPAQFTDLADGNLTGDNPLTDQDLIELSHNAFFAAVRCEVFDLGYWRDGDTVLPPRSPVDGYVYKLAECLFVLGLASSRQPDNAQFTPGQKTFPVLSNSDVGSGTLLESPYQLSADMTSGSLACTMYFSGSGISHQGTVRVICVGQRLSG
jgi:hypothetical protein